MMSPPDAQDAQDARDARDAHGIYALGVDLGTTNIKVCVVTAIATATTTTTHTVTTIDTTHAQEDAQSSWHIHSRGQGQSQGQQHVEMVYTKQVPSEATIENMDVENNKLFHEQSVHKILDAFRKCLLSIPGEIVSHIRFMNVTCQMHGVVGWNSTTIRRFLKEPSKTLNDLPDNRAFYSHLVTWQDKRCSDELMQKFNRASSSQGDSFAGSTVSNGYGCATLVWMLEHNEDYYNNYDACGTVGDFLVWLLTLTDEGAVSCFIAPSNAASFGAYSHTNMSWDIELLNSISPKILPILPTIINKPTSRCVSSNLIRQFHNPLKIGICEGDAAVALYAMLRSHLNNTDDHYTSACISIGTSCQFSLLVRSGDIIKGIINESRTPNDKDPNSQPCSYNRSIEYRPYVLHDGPIENSLILVCASMNGGGVWQKFVEEIARYNPSEDIENLHVKLIELGLQAIHSDVHVSEFADSFARQFFEKERYESQDEYESQQQKCHEQIQSRMPFEFDIHTNRDEVADVTYALAKQIILNLKHMIFRCNSDNERSYLSSIQRILVAGGALQRNPLLLHLCEILFEIPICGLKSAAVNQPDAAFGAALMEEKHLLMLSGRSV